MAPPAPNPGAYLVNPETGTTRLVPAERVNAYLSAGMRRASASEQGHKQESDRLKDKYGDKAGMAALAGLLRGGTFGLSDVALTKMGIVDPETLRQLKEQSPIASGAGDVGGSIGGLFVGPGALLLKGAGMAGKATARGVAEAGQAARMVGGQALTRAQLATARVGAYGARPIARTAAQESAHLARMAKAPTRGIVADVAGAAVQEGIVGAAFGAGAAVSDIALSKEEMSAAQVIEKLAEGTKQGATIFAGMGAGARIVGRAAKGVQKYFGRGIERLESAQAGAKIADANLEAAKAIRGDPMQQTALRVELKANQEAVSTAQEALGVARMEEAAGLGAERTAAATKTLKEAQERVIVTAQRAREAASAPNVAAVGAAEKAAIEAHATLAQASSKFSTRVAGRALGVGVAYYMGGGVGLQAAGFLMGPRMATYLGKVAKRMHGPIGGTVKEMQAAFKPEIVAHAKWPIERAVAGYATGGPAGAAFQIGTGRIEEAIGGSHVMAAITSMFPRAAEKGGLDLARWASVQAGKAKVMYADAEDWTDKQSRALADMDLTGMEAALISDVRQDIPAQIAREGVAKVVDTMAYLQEVNPADRFPSSPIPRAELKKFRAKLATVMTPEVFFKAMADGKLGPGAPEVEAMQRAYPQLLQQVQTIMQATVDKTTALGGAVDRSYYRTLNAIGVHSKKQFPVYNPARTMFLHDLVTPRQPGPKPRPKSISGIAGASATQVQRLQRGR